MNKQEKYEDFSNVEAQRIYVIPEDLPEGSYGAPKGADTPVEGKSTPGREEQRPYSAFNYQAKDLHEDFPRKYPGAHPTYDNPDA